MASCIGLVLVMVAGFIVLYAQLQYPAINAAILYFGWAVVYTVAMIVWSLFCTDMVWLTVPAILMLVWLWRHRKNVLIVRGE